MVPCPNTLSANPSFVFSFMISILSPSSVVCVLGNPLAPVAAGFPSPFEEKMDIRFVPLEGGGGLGRREGEEEKEGEERAAGWRGTLTVMMRSVDCGIRRMRVRMMIVVVGGEEGVVVVALRVRIGVDGLFLWLNRGRKDLNRGGGTICR